MKGPPATPKQIAYLNYLGVPNTDQFDRWSASREIDRLHELSEEPDQKALLRRIESWRFERGTLHADLYPDDAIAEVLAICEDEFRAIVRRRHVGCSKKLTAPIVKEVILSLCREDHQWWKDAYRSRELFYERLRFLHPGCVDGPPPKGAMPEAPLPRHAPPRSRRTSRRKLPGCIWPWGCYGIIATTLGMSGVYYAMKVALRNPRLPTANERTDRQKPPAPIAPTVFPPVLEARPTAANPFPTELRTWTAIDGRTISARAVSFDGTHVSLLREDGAEFHRVPVEILANSDQDILKKLLQVSENGPKKHGN